MYEEELAFVKNYLISHEGNNSPRPAETFRKRDQHVKRVYMWAKRIMEKLSIEQKTLIDEEALYLASIFHDVGYGSEHYKNSHNIEGSEIWLSYASGKYPKALIDKVHYLIYNHQRKDLLKDKDTDLTLVVLMEADWLDEEGAMSIAWDSITLSAISPQDYETILAKIKKYSAHILKNNPMVTEPARLFWRNKQRLVQEYIKQYEYDLFLNGE